MWLLGGDSESEGDGLLQLFPGGKNKKGAKKDKEAQVNMAPILDEDTILF